MCSDCLKGSFFPHCALLRDINEVDIREELSSISSNNGTNEQIVEER